MGKNPLEEKTKKHNGTIDLFGDLENPISNLMDDNFGYKKVISIGSHNINKNKKDIKEYCNNKQIDCCRIDWNEVAEKDVNGEVRSTGIKGILKNNQDLPQYIENKKQVILIENLPSKVNVEVLKAFVCRVSTDVNINNINQITKEKSPNKLSYIFLTDETFLYDKFISIAYCYPKEVITFNLNNFQERVKEHMIFYKNNILKIEKSGEYKNNGKEYGHILPKDSQWENIIPYKNFSHIEKLIGENNFHSGFHHLNSSQAMCMNFFYPFMKEKSLDIILKILGIEGEVDYDEVTFEKESSLDKAQGKGKGKSTNFDYFIPMKNGKKIYFEIKYTEKEFGQAKNDYKHKAIFNSIYKPILLSGKVVNDDYKQRDVFLKNYQLLRNLIHIDEDSFVVFIYPEENIGIRKSAKKA